jgi:hypothetical protein
MGCGCRAEPPGPADVPEPAAGARRCARRGYLRDRSGR